MKRNKRIVAIALLMLMIISGCGGEKDVGKKEKDKKASVEAVKPTPTPEPTPTLVVKQFTLDVAVTDEEKVKTLPIEDIQLTNITIKQEEDPIVSDNLIKTDDVGKVFDKFANVTVPYTDEQIFPNLNWSYSGHFAKKYKNGQTDGKHFYIERDIDDNLLSVSTSEEDSEAFKKELLSLYNANSYEELGLKYEEPYFSVESKKREYVSDKSGRVDMKDMDKVKETFKSMYDVGGIMSELFSKEYELIYFPSDVETLLGYPHSFATSRASANLKYNANSFENNVDFTCNHGDYADYNTITDYSISRTINCSSDMWGRGTRKTGEDIYYSFISKTQEDAENFINAFLKEYEIVSVTTSNGPDDDYRSFDFVESNYNPFNIDKQFVNIDGFVSVEVKDNSYYETNCILKAYLGNK